MPFNVRKHQKLERAQREARKCFAWSEGVRCGEEGNTHHCYGQLKEALAQSHQIVRGESGCDDGETVGEQECGTHADDHTSRDQIHALILDCTKSASEAAKNESDEASLVQERLTKHITERVWTMRIKKYDGVILKFSHPNFPATPTNDPITSKTDNNTHIIVGIVVSKSTNKTGNAITRAEVETLAMKTPAQLINSTAQDLSGTRGVVDCVISISESLSMCFDLIIAFEFKVRFI